LNVIWEKATKIIKEKISQQNFETWIRPIRITAVEGEVVRLAVPNRFFRDWLIENYRNLIREAMAFSAGVAVELEFLVEQDSQPSAGTKSDKNSPVVSSGTDRKSARNGVNAGLNPHYSFERFVVGSCNQFAHAASTAVADQPAKNYNPLFIYGGVGLGKTHLLNAIGIKTLHLYPEMHVLFVSAEVFMNELINSIRYDKMPKFREKFRNIDCMLIDDIQFIAGKERTQEEFFHTFNTLHDAGKQIVVTSDKFPKDIPNLEGRLRSRFEWGLIADIQPPEIETKIAILEKKAQENHINLPGNVALYIASQAETNIRELEGYLIRIAAYSSLTGHEIDLDLVKVVLKKLFRQEEKKEISIDEIIKTVGAKLNIKISDIKSPRKNKNLVLARQLSMFLAREMTSASFPDIGVKIGGRDHSTVIYAHNKIKKIIDTDKALRDTVEELQEVLLHKA
jgi:chromosomal replication initiator protein